MTDTACEAIRTLIPDHAADRLDAAAGEHVDDHVATCAECAEELTLAVLLFHARASVPAELPERVLEAVHADRRFTGRRPWWGLSAAAVAALAIGIGIASEPSTPVPAVPFDLTSEYEEGQLWMSDDGLLAGAPAIDGLSDEALMELLDELASTGGAA